MVRRFYDAGLAKSIKSGIKEAGCEGIRVDQEKYMNKIDYEVIVKIRTTHFLVVNFTSEMKGHVVGCAIKRAWHMSWISP